MANTILTTSRISLYFRPPFVYWHSFKLRQCSAKMPSQQCTYDNHAERQRVKAISKGDTLASSFPTCMCVAAFISAASAGNVTQHLLTFCGCHARMDREEVHEGKDSQLW
jgi:hypothetical protein